ncbi:uroporphyrinogen-III C-methyltransferase [Sphingomonas oryzagri]|jgi:uroporphyrin-III C-methyltransferase|uniref:uroporphyrinogen-III C-methyltransferase n=1 Tax=Sphingomonas oryzagri TaxID=3042314 RepID=A0ABT6MXA8_9SPHN|nr:uroporphyrinogen-III C-methyltransferase [Sphingomonas oryzagri]MDH7637673.1 uroporphyrinogen-III C-methyltransferase [Sphingomonas oryzagri]
MTQDDFAPGTVWLVGAGPGDPELLTRKAERLLGRADVVFHDALVGARVLALAGPGAELVSVGKRSGRHSKSQEDINGLLLRAAREGRRVVRLKGGDPSIFGRSAEEMDCLAAAGIRVQICPGITAASAAAASAGISLTLRGLARGLTFVTAHARAGETLAIDWPALVHSEATLAVYMGRSAAGEIARNLIATGLSAETPVLVAVDVSLPSERLVRGRLSGFPFLVEAVSDDSPTLLLIGEATRNKRAAPVVGEAVAARLATSSQIEQGQEEH